MVAVLCGGRGVAPVLLGDASAPEEGEGAAICWLMVELEGGNMISYCTGEGYPGQVKGFEIKGGRVWKSS